MKNNIKETFKFVEKLFLAAVFCYLLCGGLSLHAAGTSGAEFLKVPMGARNISMGEVGANSMDVHSLYWNPAGLAFMRAPQAGLMYYKSFDEVNYQYAALAWPFAKTVGTLGASIVRVGIPDLDNYDANGNRAGSITASDLAASLAYARRFYSGEKTVMATGFNLKAVQSKLYIYTATAYALDFGFQTYSRNLFKKDSMFKSGLSVTNLGTKIKFIQTEASLPMNFRFGLGQEQKVAKKPLNVEADINISADGGRTIGIGAEYRLAGIFIVRAGAKSGEKGAGPATKITAGMGFDLLNFQLDYAITGAGKQGLLHRFGLTFSFPTRGAELTDEQKASVEKIYQRGLEQFNKDRFADAIILFNKVIRRYPQHPSAFDKMKEAYEKIK